MQNRTKDSTDLTSMEQMIPFEVITYLANFCDVKTLRAFSSCSTFFKNSLSDFSIWRERIANDLSISKQVLLDFHKCFEPYSLTFNYAILYSRIKRAKHHLLNTPHLKVYFDPHYHFILLVACTDHKEFFDKHVSCFEKMIGLALNSLAGGEQIFKNYLNQIKEGDQLKDDYSVHFLLDAAVLTSDLDSLKGLEKVQMLGKSQLEIAITKNKEELVDYILSIFNQWRLNRHSCDKLITLAVVNGYGSIALKLWQWYYNSTKSKDYKSLVCHEFVLKEAAQTGNFESFQEFFTEDLATRELLNLAASSGNKDILEYLLKRTNLTVNLIAIENAVKAGRVELVEFLLERNSIFKTGSINTEWLYECKDAELITCIVNNPKKFNLTLNQDIVNCVVMTCDMPLIRRVFSEAYPITPNQNALKMAIVGGDLGIMKMLIAEYNLSPTIVDVEYAMQFSRMQILHYFFDPANSFKALIFDDLTALQDSKKPSQYDMQVKNLVRSILTCYKIFVLSNKIPQEAKSDKNTVFLEFKLKSINEWINEFLFSIFERQFTFAVNFFTYVLKNPNEFNLNRNLSQKLSDFLETFISLKENELQSKHLAQLLSIKELINSKQSTHLKLTM